MNLALVTTDKYKKCGSSTCEQTNPQPLDSFYKSKSRKDGLYHVCKMCSKKSNQKWSKANPEKNAAKARRLRKELKEKNPEKAWSIRRNQRLKDVYGITLDEYKKMHADQKGLCSICGSKDNPGLSNSGKYSNLVVDHDHKSGRVRSLLCGGCNVVLGSARENIAILRQAISYLEKHSGY